MPSAASFAKILSSHCVGRRGGWAHSGLVPKKHEQDSYISCLWCRLGHWPVPLRFRGLYTWVEGFPLFFLCNVKNPQLKWEQLSTAPPEQQDLEWEILQTAEHHSLGSLESWRDLFHRQDHTHWQGLLFGYLRSSAGEKTLNLNFSRVCL